jgi:molybdenum cofactor synthesis domain-containing protein
VKAKVLTVSDGVAGGAKVDGSGPAVAAQLGEAGFDVIEQAVVADGVEPVSAALRAMVAGFDGLVVTTGGTGFSPRDLTPEATAAVIERAAPGLVTAMTLANPDKGRLSRATAGTAGGALIINLPGSTAGATECLAAVIDVLPHALDLLAGRDAGH